MNANTSDPTAQPYDDLPGALSGITAIHIDCADMDLNVEADASLRDRVLLLQATGRDAPILIQDGDQLVISQSGRHRGGNGTPTLRVPATGCPPITGEHRRGTLRMTGVIGAIDLHHNSGDVTLRQVQADLNLKVDKGDLTLIEVAGQATLSCGSGDVQIMQLQGLLHLALGSGDVTMRSSSGDAEMSLGSGDVTVDGFAGGLRLRIGSGDTSIIAPHHAALNLRAGSGDATIHGGTATSLNIKLGRGDITSSARLVPDDGRTTINEPEQQESLLSGMRIDDDGVRFSGRNLRFEATSAGVRIEKSGTSIEADERGVRIVRGQRGATGQYELETAKGDISVNLASDTPVRVEAIIQGGDVHSDVPLVSVGRPGPRGATQRFVGVSDAQATRRVNVRLKTDRGDIRVRTVSMPNTPRAHPDDPTIRMTTQPAETFAPADWPGVPTTPPQPPTPPARPTPPAPPVSGGAPGTVGERQMSMREVLDALSRGEISVEEADRRLRSMNA